jgi:ribonuclease R
MIYRVHDEPSEEKLSRFRDFALRFGHYFKASKGRAVAREMNKLLGEVAGRSEANAITTLAVRSMAKAQYTTDNIGHYGLGFPYYTHFTSPIRRYPDLMVHRLLYSYLNNASSANIEFCEEQCKHSSLMERKAAEAERTSVKYKQAEFLSDKIGQEFPALISGVSKWGIYAEIEENKCEGMISLGSLQDDYYYLDEDNYQVIGRRYGRQYKLGDSIRIKVLRVDMEKKQMDFALIETEEPIAPRSSKPEKKKTPKAKSKTAKKEKKTTKSKKTTRKKNK